MRVLQLIDTLDPGGAERMAVNMANTFEETGVKNLLVVSRSRGGLADLVVNQDALKVLGKKKTLDKKAFKMLLENLNQFKPDVVHAHGTSIYWAVALRLLKGNFRLVWHDHLGISEEVIKNNPRKELKLMAPFIDLIITANESTREYWVDKKLKKPSKVSYLANFPHLIPEKLSKNEVFTILHLANFRREKGQKFLIQSAKKLKELGVKFQIYLTGKVVDEKWKQECEEMIKESSLKGIVSIQPPVSNVAPLLAKVHAGVVASEREGLPVALLEYGLAGLPVVSTNVGQCPDVLIQGKFGQIVDFGNAEKMAIALKSLAEYPEGAHEKGIEFQRHIQKNYGSINFMNGYNELLFTNFGFNLFEN